LFATPGEALNALANNDTDKSRRGRPKNDSVPEWRIGIMDGNIASSATGRPCGYLYFAVLRERRSRGALGRLGSRRMERSSGRNLGNELSRIRREHWPGAAFPDWAGGAHGVRRIATSCEWPASCALRRESRRIRRAPCCC